MRSNLSTSFGAMTRGSPAMIARRRRILSEARRMIATGGIEGLAMRELALRADVSLRTLYNAFGSKEQLVVAAIRQYFDRFLRAVCDDRDPYDLNAIIETVVAINLRNQQIRPYLTALVGIYFAPGVESVVKVELRRTATGFMLPWLDLMQTSGQLAPGTDIQRLTANLANIQYAINQEWLAGMLGNEAFVPAILEGVLTYLAGCLQNGAAASVQVLLRDVRGERALTRKLIDETYRRLTELFAGASALWVSDDASATEFGGPHNAT